MKKQVRDSIVPETFTIVARAPALTTVVRNVLAVTVLLPAIICGQAIIEAKRVLQNRSRRK